MKSILKYISVAAYIAFMTATAGCTHEKNELVHNHAHEHGHGHEHNGEGEGHDHDEHRDHDEEHDHHSHEGHDHGSGDEITLEPGLAKQLGVKTEHVHPDMFSNSLRVTGKVLGTAATAGSVSAPTAGIFTFSRNLSVGSTVSRGQVIGTIRAQGISGGDVNAAAKASLEAAKREMERLKPLYEKQLVTAEKYNAAVAAYNVAKAQYSPAAAGGAVTSPVSGTVTEVLVGQGEYVEPGTIIAKISDGSNLTLVADVPDRYAASVASIKDARILTNHSKVPVSISELGGHKVTSGPTISSTPGYIPVVFSFANDGVIVPGSIVEVYLLGDSRGNVISVPLSAVTEQQGNYFVYIKIDDEGYIKSPVKLGARDGKRVEILQGVSPHDDVVVEGVTALRLAETSGAVPEGHSHSH